MNRELALHFALRSDDNVELGILGGDSAARRAGWLARALPALAAGGDCWSRSGGCRERVLLTTDECRTAPPERHVVLREPTGEGEAEPLGATASLVR